MDSFFLKGDGYWWSLSAKDLNSGWSVEMSDLHSSTILGDDYNKKFGFSVGCFM